MLKMYHHPSLRDMGIWKEERRGGGGGGGESRSSTQGIAGQDRRVQGEGDFCNSAPEALLAQQQSVKGFFGLGMSDSHGYNAADTAIRNYSRMQGQGMRLQ